MTKQLLKIRIEIAKLYIQLFYRKVKLKIANFNVRRAERRVWKVTKKILKCNAQQ